MLYAIHVNTSELLPNGWTRSNSFPTFFLRDDLQGIRDAAHAECIALKMLEEVARPGIKFYVTAQPVD